MTWTKLSDDFGVDCANAGLSDAAFRTHVEGLLWTMKRETDGAISQRDLIRLAEVEDPAVAAQELEARGFWTREAGKGWRIRHHMEHQPESVVLARRREMNSERQRRTRLKKAGVDDDSGNATGHAVTNRVTERVTRDGSGRDGAGRDGAGRASPTEEEQSSPATARSIDACKWCEEPLGDDDIDGMHLGCAEEWADSENAEHRLDFDA